MLGLGGADSKRRTAAADSPKSSDGSVEALARTLEAVVGRQAQLEATIARHAEERAALKAQVERLELTAAGQSDTIRVGQYNILAGYLGDNKQPWFLYGLPGLSSARRAQIEAKAFERGADGKYKNKGFEAFTSGILSADEQATIESVHATQFAWEARRERLVQTIEEMGADLLSLVELDHFDDFFRPALEARGYAACYRKRPRAASKDGCCVVYRAALFTLVASEHIELVDRFDAERGAAVKDRIALLVLLRHTSGKQLIFISTHLQRNPEEAAQTQFRVREAAQIFQKLSLFAAAHGAMEAAVVLAGDLNTTNVRQIGNIARVIFDLTDEPAHRFMYQVTAPRTRPTSVTCVRRVAIDYLLYDPADFHLDDQAQLPRLSPDDPIPNAAHPSDHVPICMTLSWRRQRSQLYGFAASWVQMLLSDTDHDAYVPLTAEGIAQSFEFFDVDTDGAIDLEEVKDGLRELGYEARIAQVLAVMKTELEVVAAEEKARAAADDAADGADDGAGLLAQVGEQPRAIISAISRGGGGAASDTVPFKAILEWQLDKPLVLRDFIVVYKRCFRFAKEGFRGEMRQVFSYFDSDGSNSLTHDELAESFRACCPFPVSARLFEQIWRLLDGNNDGRVDLDEFVDAVISAELNDRKMIVRTASGMLSQTRGRFGSLGAAARASLEPTAPNPPPGAV